MLKTTVLAAFVASALGVPGCDKAGTTGTGRLQVALTDAPGDGIQAAVIAISEIYLMGENGRVVISDRPMTIDLVSLSNSSETIVDAVVPAGHYSELRFVVDGAYVEMQEADGLAVYATPGFEDEAGGVIAGELKTPSWGASGLKIKLRDDGLDVGSDQKILLVDFDVAESFRTDTGNGAVVMSPVVFAQDILLTTSLEVRATLSADVGAGPFFVTLYDREGFVEGTMELTDFDGDGIYTTTFVYLDSGEGPFSAEVKTADGLVVLASPELALIEGVPGYTVETDVTLIAIVNE